MNLTFTRCQDRNCPKTKQCQRYDSNYTEQKGMAYFARSPRVKDECGYFEPFNGAPLPKPMTSDWPKDDQ